jgi:aminoglycoside phosphotransferase (APT) family kinase protein
MDQVQGLEEYIKWKGYRERLGLPKEVTEKYRMLAQGEYNRNYLFLHPVTGKKLILRVNFGSQMHLEDQIGYEFQALELLKDSGRTPRPLYVDGTKEKLPFGIMVMEYLSGHALDYEKELLYAADCLADIHSIDLGKETPLVAPDNPLKAILEECEEMFRTYEESALGDEGKKRKIRRMLDRGWERSDSLPKPDYRCCINTELNSTNFLINGEGKGNYLIDWEKPIYGDPAQDLGHFLAPTTTFWKTDVILESEQMEKFTDAYIKKAAGRFNVDGLKERTWAYIPITCLRGITWCAMAWVEYKHPDKEIINESTARKLEAYLSHGFLDKIAGFVG